MKKIINLLIFTLLTISSQAQTVLAQENFQDWKAEPGIAPVPPSKSPSGVEYTITKKLFDGKTDGTFTSNALIVAPTQAIGNQGKAEGNGNPSTGRIAIKGAKNFLQLPELYAVSKIIIKASAGTDLKEFKLQIGSGKYFNDVEGSITSCSKEIIKAFTFEINSTTPTTIRIVPTSGSSIYIWDIQVLSKK